MSAPWFTWAQNAILNLRDSVSAWGEREAVEEKQELSDRQRITRLESLLEQTHLDFFTLSAKVKQMANDLDVIDSKFDTYQALVVKTIADLKAEVAAELSNQLDPVKAKAIEDKMDAAIATLSPAPAPAPTGDPAAVPTAG